MRKSCGKTAVFCFVLSEIWFVLLSCTWPFLPQVQQGITVQNRATALQSGELSSSSIPQNFCVRVNSIGTFTSAKLAWTMSHTCEGCISNDTLLKTYNEKNKLRVRVLDLSEKLLNLSEAASEPWSCFLDETNSKWLDESNWIVQRDNA